MGEPRFGVLANIGQPEDSEEIERVCRAADRLGYDSLAFGDHLSWPIPEAWTVLAWAAGLTDRIGLTHLVLNNTYRHPSLLAQMGASLDFLSGGRFELSIGAGAASRAEYRPYGFASRPFAERVTRLEEALTIIRTLWEEGQCTFDGELYNVQDASLSPKPTQTPRPPVLIGGQSDELMNLAAEYEGWNFGFDLSPTSCRKRLDALEDYSGTDASERGSFRTPLGVLFLIDRNQERLTERVRDTAEARGMTEGEFRRQFADSFVGLPGEILQRVREYREVGISDFFLWGPSVRRPDDLELFVTEVIPEVD